MVKIASKYGNISLTAPGKDSQPCTQSQLNLLQSIISHLESSRSSICNRGWHNDILLRNKFVVTFRLGGCVTYNYPSSIIASSCGGYRSLLDPTPNSCTLLKPHLSRRRWSFLARATNESPMSRRFNLTFFFFIVACPIAFRYDKNIHFLNNHFTKLLNNN